MAFYLNPLNDSIVDVRTELLHLKKLGTNRCKYYMKNNEELTSKILTMVANDVTAQWLMGE